MRGLLVLIFVAALEACTAAPAIAPPPTRTASTDPSIPFASVVFTPTADAKQFEGGCGSTTVMSGGVSDTLRKWAGYNAPSGVPYAIAHPATAAGFIFGYPLHTPSAGIGYTNKILWVVGTPRTGELVVEGAPLGKTAPTVRYSFPANSGPGEIYPSGVDVPEPGCWSFTLRWAGQTAAIELLYR
jgi:hypothetical protein